MGKRYGVLFIALVATMALIMLSIKPVAAYSGVTGTVVDGKTNSGWEYGAEVAAYQLNAPFGPLGSTILAADGTFTLVYGTDPLNVCGGACVTAADGNQIVLVINFQCDLNTVNGTRPDHNSSTDVNCPVDGPLPTGTGGPELQGLPQGISYFYLENPSPGNHAAGNLVTNTGPTAITLRSFNISAGGSLPVFLIATFFLLVGGVSLAAVRRRKS